VVYCDPTIHPSLWERGIVCKIYELKTQWNCLISRRALDKRIKDGPIRSAPVMSQKWLERWESFACNNTTINWNDLRIREIPSDDFDIHVSVVNETTRVVRRKSMSGVSKIVKTATAKSIYQKSKVAKASIEKEVENDQLVEISVDGEEKESTLDLEKDIAEEFDAFDEGNNDYGLENLN
jgi:hypothetical protein